jgi:hypothetical protein
MAVGQRRCQKMLRIARQKWRRPTPLRQGSHTLGRSLTFETLHDESAMSGFGLGRPLAGKTRRAKFGKTRQGGLRMPWLLAGPDSEKRVEHGRITQWLGAFLVTTDQRSLRDRTPALACHPMAAAQRDDVPVFPITAARFECLQIWRRPRGPPERHTARERDG